jgi:DNA-binding NtrC family response regulator
MTHGSNIAFRALLGESPAMKALRSLILQVAPTDISVLIIGESGTGKELVARAIHEKSQRANKPILFVNCGAIPEGIFESEIFGHERGSFTSADRQRAGYFEQADGGTLVLDEIGEMPVSVQVKLLRVLETGEFMRVGSSRTQRVNVRIVAATNVDLAAAVSRNDFRQDLYYRLKAVTIAVPPLRERISDIPLLVDEFARRFCDRNQLTAPRIDESAKRLLMDQYWSGNIRELRNTVESVLTLSAGRLELSGTDFRPHLQPATSAHLLPVPLHRPPETLERELVLRALLDLRREVGEVKNLLLTAIARVDANSEAAASAKLDDLEREQILKTLEQNGGNRRRTARDLGIGERTLYRKLKEYEIS